MFDGCKKSKRSYIFSQLDYLKQPKSIICKYIDLRYAYVNGISVSEFK
jgi:hypothetical protein